MLHCLSWFALAWPQESHRPAPQVLPQPPLWSFAYGFGGCAHESGWLISCRVWTAGFRLLKFGGSWEKSISPLKLPYATSGALGSQKIFGCTFVGSVGSHGDTMQVLVKSPGL